ncbi:Hsp20 family protein [bacterium]|nr:Hsp20 family protein [bacterium]
MTRLTTLNLPSMHKHFIGFDQMFDDMDRLFENSAQKGAGYPPYNIAQINEDEFMVTLAVAGFSMDDLDVTKEGNVLSIEGSKNPSDDTVNYLHKGIAERTFRRDFTLADHVDVRSADLELGMLNIHLVREVPEAMKPKKIAINSETTIDAVGYDNK